MGMEKTDIEDIAKPYRDDGYHILLEPGRHELPEFLKGFDPGMIATKGDERVVVEVATRDQVKNQKTKKNLEYWIGKVNSEPGWRFDLVIVNREPWPDPISADSKELDPEEIRARNRTIQPILSLRLIEPASLYAWSMVEAAMRVVAERFRIALVDKTPFYVMKTLYSKGVISNAEFDDLQRLMKIRNSIAHGLKTSKLDGDIPLDMMSITERLLIIAEGAKSAKPRPRKVRP
jgi:hypothetical protein